MGYLNNSTVTVDAILTRRGRQLLADGSSKFNITQFALADDEIDYTLWNNMHPLGSAYYGAVIENMPLIEASSDERNMMRHKLITLPKGSSTIPHISISTSAIAMLYQMNTRTGNTQVLKPSTTDNLNGTLGYTVTVADVRVANIFVTKAAPGAAGVVDNYIGDNSAFTNSKTVVGLEFEVRAQPTDPTKVKTTVITITGNETGGTITIPVTATTTTATNTTSTSTTEITSTTP